MKKRLESELISIAHRILKLKNKSEVDQLYKETQKLYETLTVLKFYQDNFELVKDDVSANDLEEKLENPIENAIPVNNIPEIEKETTIEETSISEELENMPEAILTEEPLEEEIAVATENKAEVVQEEPIFRPIFELEVEQPEEKVSDSEIEAQIEPAEIASEIKPETKQVALEDLLGENYVDPIFVKPNEVSLFSSDTKSTEEIEPTHREPKLINLNSSLSKSIEIGLNDRIAFVNHLFGESNEDFNRVISQLNTFDTLEEAKNFINEMVIPDYNYWVGKEEYLERFMEIVEKKFK
ncbi:hypothetical protein WFZ85_07655 [Flavobacterium sp. j3]|uniref:Uncharacterized protein n=1 Tax=Flavobacterium aureirubrum TaxID=3133147 RepID=A0ABU9N4N3_9FLAO